MILTGDLGAGKTTLTQGIGEGLGVRGEVTSPTFVIARVHPSLSDGPPLVHVDAYRLGGTAELDDLDLDTDIDEAVTVVEWGEGLAEALSVDRLELSLKRTDDDQRTITLTPGRPPVARVRPRLGRLADQRLTSSVVRSSGLRQMSWQFAANGLLMSAPARSVGPSCQPIWLRPRLRHVLLAFDTATPSRHRRPARRDVGGGDVRVGGVDAARRDAGAGDRAGAGRRPGPPSAT